MLSGTLLKLAVVALTTIALVYCEDTRDVMVEKYGMSVVLNCTHTFPTVNYTIFWQITDETHLYPGGQSNPRVLPGGKQLEVKDIALAHEGEYICHVLETGKNETLQYKTRLRVVPLSQWETYRLSTIVGVLAAVFMAIIAAGACLVYHFRWERRSGYSKEKFEYPPPDSHINRSFSDADAANGNSPYGKPQMETTDTYI